MDEGKEIVDEFAELQRMKKEIEAKLEYLRMKIIGFSVDNGKGAIFGSHKFCTIKSYDKVVYPANKEDLINLIKQKGLYEQLSSINYFKLSPRILKGEVDQEIINLTKKEKDFRVTLKDKTELVVG